LAMMGDRKFRMGSVNDDSYAEIFLSPIMRDLANKSCVETLPGCHSCALQVFCGTDPIRNYSVQGDIVGHRPTSEFCAKNRGVIRHLLRVIEKGDPDILDVFWSWITDRSLSEIRGMDT
jgi:uncharacterized protein